MKRPRLPWLVALPLIVAGTFAAHLSAGLFGPLAPVEGSVAAEAAERGATGGVAQVPLGAGLVLALALALVARALVAHRRGAPAGAGKAVFLVLPPLAFLAQELLERVLATESAPFSAQLEPRLLVGLVVQLPFGLAAYAAARLVWRVLGSAGARLAGSALVAAAPAPATPRPPRSIDLPLRPALAVGHAGRGPPGRR